MQLAVRPAEVREGVWVVSPRRVDVLAGSIERQRIGKWQKSIGQNFVSLGVGILPHYCRFAQLQLYADIQPLQARYVYSLATCQRAAILFPIHRFERAHFSAAAPHSCHR